jgi:hypothetical protein
MGFEVTAVDIEEKFCELIKKRADLNGVRINVINSDFFWIEECAEQADAVLFFESFHHSSDHVRLVRSLKKAIKKGGFVLFAGEPITPDFPLPWGVRLDGESLRAIRKFGWLELGFSEEYFITTLKKLGWSVEKYPSTSSCGTIYKAIESKDYSKKFYATNKKLLTQIGSIEENSTLVSNGKEGYLIYGPYTYLPKGEYKTTFYFSEPQNLRGRGYIDIVSQNGNNILARREFNFHKFWRKDEIEIIFMCLENEPDVECRLYCYKNSNIKVKSIEIVQK